MITTQSYLGLFSIFLLLNNAAFAAIYDSVIQDAELVSQSEDMLSVDEQVMVVADLSNGQDRNQNFAYIVQIRNEKDSVISLSRITGNLTPGQKFSPALSWIPTVPGSHMIEISVWESLDNPDVLSAPLLLTVEVI